MNHEWQEKLFTLYDKARDVIWAIVILSVSLRVIQAFYRLSHGRYRAGLSVIASTLGYYGAMFTICLVGYIAHRQIEKHKDP